MNHGWLDKETQIAFIQLSFEKFLSSSLNLLPISQTTQNKLDIKQHKNGYYSYTSQSLKENSICYWEKPIFNQEMNIGFLKDIVNQFFLFLKIVEKDLHGIKSFLPQALLGIKLSDLENLYPEYSYERAIRAITQKHGAVFILGKLSTDIFVWDCIREDRVNLGTIELLSKADTFFETPRIILSDIYPQVIRGKIDFKSLVGLLMRFVDLNLNEYSFELTEQ